MVVGAGTADGGDGEGGVPIDIEKQLLDAELIEAECILAGEVQQIESLAQENFDKVETLRDLEADVKALEQRNQYHVSMLREEQTSAQQELTHRLSVLHEQLAHLDLKHERYREASRVSDEAGAEVQALLAKMERRTKTHAEEVPTKKKEMLHLAQGLESTFRTTLKDLEGTYRRKAFDALGSEAKVGMRANKILHEEMALQEVGVSALYGRHLAQSQKGRELKDEIHGLKKSKKRHKANLVQLQREARTNHSIIADMHETKMRIAAANRCLRDELGIEGVPDCSLAEIREMSSKERAESRRLDRLKGAWQKRVEGLTRAIFSSSSAPQLDASAVLELDETVAEGIMPPPESSAAGKGRFVNQEALRGSKSTPPGNGFFRDSDVYSGEKDLNAGWRARVRQAKRGWADIDDLGYRLRVSTKEMSSGALRGVGASDGAHAVVQSQEGVASRLNGRRSASLPALLAGFAQPPSRRSDATSPSVNKSSGQFGVRFVSEEDPWQRKHRMERSARRRDAQIRAKGLPVNTCNKSAMPL